jgi:hypothetical protein
MPSGHSFILLVLSEVGEKLLTHCRWGGSASESEPAVLGVFGNPVCVPILSRAYPSV